MGIGRKFRREAGLGPIAVVAVVAVAAVVVIGGKTLWDSYVTSDEPGASVARQLANGEVPPTATAFVGSVTFTEAGSIPFNGGTRTANVVTTYVAAERSGSPTALVTQQIDIHEVYPAPANLPPDPCWVSEVREIGTITGESAVAVSRPEQGIVLINAGDALGAAGPTRTITHSGSGCRVKVETTEGLRSTGPWSYRGPAGDAGPSGLEASGTGLPTTNGRFLNPGMTSVTFDIGAF